MRCINGVILVGLLGSFTTLTWATCIAEIPESTPNSQLTDNGNGTITDTATGLMWKQCSEGQSGSDCSTSTGIKHDWQAALQIPATLNAAGGFATYTDWRLPNIKELLTIVEVACYGLAINSTRFPNTRLSGAVYFWTASAHYKSIYAWAVAFWSGDTDNINRGNSNGVRLVRSVQ